jgi:HAD superfamily hydrolase (TIGR01509 family)
LNDPASNSGPGPSAGTVRSVAIKEIVMALKAVLFDIDGTLVDSNRLHVEAWARAFDEKGHDIARDAIAGQIGKGGKMLVETLVPGIDGQAAEAIDERHGVIFKSDQIDKARPFPEARALIERCAASGLRVVLGSSASRAELDHYVDLLGIADAIHAATSADDVETAKPAPDIFGVALERAGAAPAEAIAVGDSPFDIEAAGKAGVATIAVRSGGFPDAALGDAIAIYDDVADLLAHYAQSALAKRPPMPR